MSWPRIYEELEYVDTRTDDTSKCCDAGCTTRAEMRERHGDPDKFAVSCFAAVPAFISVDEANAAIERYRGVYSVAPEEHP